MVCMAIEVYLQRNDFRVTIADGGEAGLRALEHEQFDLMIIDIFMPHMRGFESIRVFHERAPVIPLIAMSGYAFADLNSPAPDFLRMALELGAARCLRQAVHAARAARRHQRLPRGAPSRRCRRGRAPRLALHRWHRGRGKRSLTLNADPAESSRSRRDRHLSTRGRRRFHARCAYRPSRAGLFRARRPTCTDMFTRR
ncbi:CheY-like chemotaxis protein [Bradyrhizobium huanghuaihaiense]|uniref:Response regulator receiver domain-containing protein n=1 Tax=Bradyrhizobium huanghuaihaiense TaxID=990078 RepID=A0A562S7Z9_9BRAD|nr:response regulator receiver domain-containing protein [Bradyrhizobium huanghuaihaiense]